MGEMVERVGVAEPKVLKGKLENPGSGPVRCEVCGVFLQRGDRIAYTLDMRRFWHSECFEKTLVPLKDLRKSATSKPSQGSSEP